MDPNRAEKSIKNAEDAASVVPSEAAQLVSEIITFLMECDKDASEEALKDSQSNCK